MKFKKNIEKALHQPVYNFHMKLPAAELRSIPIKIKADGGSNSMLEIAGSTWRKYIPLS